MLKKVLCAILSLILVLSLAGLASCAEGPLDAAFEAGVAALVETEHAGFDLAGCNIVIPDAYWSLQGMEKPSAEALRGLTGQALAAASVFSVSPAGTSALIDAGGVFALNGGTITALIPSETRGVADEYGNMGTLFKTGLRAFLNTEGVVWSPDGRYAVIPNIDRAIKSMQLICDPMVIDTVTGEVFLTATYGSRIIPREGEANGGALTSACFSRDGRYLYYTFYGSLGQGRYALLRCEPDTGKTELLYSGDEMIYYPRLSELRDGSFMILSDERDTSRPMGVARLAPGGLLAGLTGGGWSVTTASFGLPLAQWRVTQLEYSAESGWAFCLGGTAQGNLYALQRFRPDEGCAGIEQRWMMRSDTCEFEPVEGDTRDALIRTFSDGKLLPDAEYLVLLAGELSPDGRYALVQVRSANIAELSFPLYLVRLEDMKAVPVTGLPENLSAYRTPLARKYAPGMEWNGDQILLLVDGQVRSYQFDVKE